MDSLFGSREQEAKALTREIEAATNGDAPVEGADSGLTQQAREDLGLAQRGADLDLARREAMSPGIGKAAISTAVESVVKNTETEADREINEQEVARSNQIVKEMVAAENGYSKDERLIGANLVGAESRLEVKQRTRDDDDDFKMETGEGWQHEILTKGQEKLTDETVRQIDRIIRNESYNPRQLERERFLGMSAILATYGRKLGDRN